MAAPLASGDFSSEQLINEGTLTVGTDTLYPPFEFGDAPDYNGFDVNLVDEIANRLGPETKWVDTSFDDLHRCCPGQVRHGCLASTITPDRQKTVNFDPYYSAQQALLVPEGSDISLVEDLDGKTVGAQNGTTGKDFCRERDQRQPCSGLPERSGRDRSREERPGQKDHHRPAGCAGRDRQGSDRVRGGNDHPDRSFTASLAKDTPELLAAVNKTLAEMMMASGQDLPEALQHQRARRSEREPMTNP